MNSNLWSLFIFNKNLNSILSRYFSKFIYIVSSSHWWLLYRHYVLHCHSILFFKWPLCCLIQITNIMIAFTFSNKFLSIFIIQIISYSHFISVCRLIFISIFLKWYFHFLFIFYILVLKFWIIWPCILIISSFNKDYSWSCFHITFYIQIRSSNHLIFLF